eukprot:Hpha_TRINITY_DN15868_c3_g1::TRINITY_DN15868_c3_g1_i1::g.192205::m.192205
MKNIQGRAVVLAVLVGLVDGTSVATVTPAQPMKAMTAVRLEYNIRFNGPLIGGFTAELPYSAIGPDPTTVRVRWSNSANVATSSECLLTPRASAESVFACDIQTLWETATVLGDYTDRVSSLYIWFVPAWDVVGRLNLPISFVGESNSTMLAEPYIWVNGVDSNTTAVDRPFIFQRGLFNPEADYTAYADPSLVGTGEEVTLLFPARATGDISAEQEVIVTLSENLGPIDGNVWWSADMRTANHSRCSSVVGDRVWTCDGVGAETFSHLSAGLLAPIQVFVTTGGSQKVGPAWVAAELRGRAFVPRVSRVSLAVQGTFTIESSTASEVWDESLGALIKLKYLVTSTAASDGGETIVVQLSYVDDSSDVRWSLFDDVHTAHSCWTNSTGAATCSLYLRGVRFDAAPIVVYLWVPPEQTLAPEAWVGTVGFSAHWFREYYHFPRIEVPGLLFAERIVMEPAVAQSGEWIMLSYTV